MVGLTSLSYTQERTHPPPIVPLLLPDMPAGQGILHEHSQNLFVQLSTGTTFQRSNISTAHVRTRR